MTIEFHCPFCQKLLKTPDDRAGVHANCPGCGEMVTVPSPAHEAAHADLSLAMLDPVAGPRADGANSGTNVEEAVFDEAPAGETKKCPMCGAEIKLTAKRCRFCGEDLFDRGSDAADGRIEAGDIISRSWDLFQKNMGVLVGSTLVLMGIGLVAVVAGYIGMVIAMISLIGAGPAPQGPSAGAIAALVGMVIFFVFLMFAVNAFLQGGYHILMMRVARGERAEIGDMFAGSRFFWRLFWGNVLFTLMTYAGLALLIVPGVFVILFFWPFSFIIVDRNTGVVESLRKAKDLMNDNLAAIFVLGLAAIGMNMVGQMACYVGLIFSIPLSNLMFALAYCRMARQLPPDRRTAPVEA